MRHPLLLLQHDRGAEARGDITSTKFRLCESRGFHLATLFYCFYSYNFSTITKSYLWVGIKIPFWASLCLLTPWIFFIYNFRVQTARFNDLKFQTQEAPCMRNKNNFMNWSKGNVNVYMSLSKNHLNIM